MTLSLRRVESETDRKAVVAARRRIGPAVFTGTAEVELVAFEGRRAIAGVAWSGFASLPEDSRWRACIDPLEVPVPLVALATIHALWFDPPACSGEAVQLLLDHMVDELVAAGFDIALLATPAHLVSHAEVLGFRRMGDVFDETDGLRLAMALVIGDWSHLERVRSPLLPAVRRHLPNFELPDWFDERLREHHRPAGVRAQRVAVFLHNLVTSWHLSAAPLLEDLVGENLDWLRSIALAVAVPAGQSVLRKGDNDHDLYLILDGAVEVSETVRDRREVLATLGAGQIFGEGGFFAKTPRSADITAIAPTRLLVLAPAAFELLGREHPQAAIHVLQALGRALCLRVYAGVTD